MKVAIIEDSAEYQTLFKDLLKDFNWDLDYFSDSKEFGKAPINGYDVIVSDYSLPKMTGRDLIHSISDKTSAAIFLMSAEGFTQEDIENDHISGLINKTEPENLVDQLKYMDAKIRINKRIEEDQAKCKNMVTMANSMTNGFSVEVRDGVVIIGIKQELSKPSKSKILNEIDKYRKCVIYFPKRNTIASAVLGILVSLFKHTQDKKGSLVFWNESKKKETEDQLNLCKLTSLFPIFKELDDAVKYLKDIPS